MGEPATRLRRIAWINAVVHVLGLVFAAFAMRPGTSQVPLEDRLAFLTGEPLGWKIGWSVWIVAALLLLALFSELRGRIKGSASAGRFALAVAATGVAVDVLCGVGQMTVLPLAAASDVELFHLADALFSQGGIIGANGLYCVAMLVVNVELAKNGEVPTWVRLAGFGTFAAGTVMLVGGVIGSPLLILASTGPTALLFSVWGVALAYKIA